MKYTLAAIIISLAFLLSGCLTEPALKVPFSSYTPEQINDGWQTTSPSQAKIDSMGLINVFRDFHNYEDVWQVRSLSVFRDGKLVAESYTRDVTDKRTPRAIWSATKQVIGILVGIAVDKGLIQSIDDPIVKYLPEVGAYPDKKSITIKNLLMMQSGIDYENYGFSGDDSKILQQLPDNYLEFILKKRMNTAPGSTFDYKDSDPQILSAILERVSGKLTSEWADEVLFSKIGFRNYNWNRYRDGSTLGSFGIMTTPREMAKIAQLALDGGRFNGNQIVSEAWVKEMTSPLVKAADKHFGYQWWSYPEQKTYFMSGNGRQIAFVFPEQSLVVVITSETNLQGRFNLNTVTARNYAERITKLCY